MSRKKSDKEKAVDVAKDIAKIRAGYKCEKCPKTKEQGWQMHGAHIMPVTYGGTAADPDNILCLCATCHSIGKTSAHQDHTGFGIWFENKWPGRYQELHDKAIAYDQNPFPKIDWVEKRKELLEIKKTLDTL